MTDKRSFGSWLKQRRKALGLTQKDLAQRAGCAEVTLRKIEAGDLQPSPALVASLARVAGAGDADLPGLLSLARGADDDFTARARLLRPQRPHNLPAQLTPLIGREQDIAAVRKRLLSDGARLMTLVGPPGVGKTRLALAVAEDLLEQFEHGAFFVRLGPVSDPTLVAAAIAQALGMEMSGPNPPELQLRAWLEEKHLLLLLDNFEQIIAAAPRVDDLLRRCPWLHVLVTSRQPLRVRGERQMTVRPLALPVTQPGGGRLTADDALRYAAVALFAERAEAVQPNFAVDDGNAAAVAELCRRLDGLPLAIELVAARVKLLPPADLLVRLNGPWLLSTDGLRDVSERQRTLRGAIGWSYDLLSPVEQTLFTRLAVFVGGCTLEAAEMMCEDILPPAHVLDHIASLLDKSLLRRETGLYDEPRYAMLETVREYALERSVLSGDGAALRSRHANCFLRIIEHAEQGDLDPSHVRLLRRIDDDIHNVRAAFAWAMEHDAQAALLFTASLLDWLKSRGPFREGSLLIDEVFVLPGSRTRTMPRAKALFMAAMLLFFNGDAGRAQVYAEECLVLSQELGYAKGVADALLSLGRIAHSGWHDEVAARHYLAIAVASYKALSYSGGIAHALVVLSEIAFYQGDYQNARELAEECVAVAQHAGLSSSWPLGLLGSIAWVEGDLDRARLIYEQQLAVERPRGSKANLAYALTGLGNIATRQCDYTAAHTYLSEALELSKGMNQVQVHRCYVPLAALAQAEGDYKRAIGLYQESLAGITHNPDLWGAYLLNLAYLARVAVNQELTAKLLGAVEAVDALGYRLSPDDRNEYNHLADSARSLLGVDAFDTAWNEGRTLTFEQAAEEAVSILEAALHIPSLSR